MKRMLIISWDLRAGGVQTSLISLLSSLCAAWSIDLYLMDDSDSLLADMVPSAVRIIASNPLLKKAVIADTAHHNTLSASGNTEKLLIRIIQRLGLERGLVRMISRNTFKEKYDVVVSYTGMPGMWDRLAEAVVPRRCRIAYVHNTPSALGLNRRNVYRLYNRFDIIVCVSKSIRDQLAQLEERIAGKTRVVYNRLDTCRIDAMLCGNPSPYSEERHVIVTAARLMNRSKRIDRIIAAAQKLLAMGLTDFSWHIVGSGPDEEQIRRWIYEAYVEDHVFLDGHMANPFPYIRYADLLVLSSDYEGLPVVMMEALYLKTPVISTDMPCSRELLRNGVNGLIVEKSADAIAEGIFSFFTRQTLREQIQRNVERLDYNSFLSGDTLLTVLERQSNE